MNGLLSGLYAVTPDMADSTALAAKVEAALRGGARIIQYRSKSANMALRRAQAESIARLCRSWKATFIINDSAELARELDADGVHLGRDDVTVGEARATMAPGKLIGVSCYNEMARARQAQAQGADYVAFGSFFPSATKPAAPAAGAGLLRSAATELALPVVAIGGVDADNAGALIAAGADCVAVVSALFDATDIEAQARRFTRLFDVQVPLMGKQA
jgi:thiamine-phosphate pyrophosphorylase